MPSDNQPKLSRNPKEHNPASVDLAERIVAIQWKSALYVLILLTIIGSILLILRTTADQRKRCPLHLHPLHPKHPP